MDAASKRWRMLLALCAVATVVPLFCTRHLPMADVPEHLAVMATLRHYFDPAWHAREYFILGDPLQTQYWLYHLTGAALAFVVGGAERANLIILAAVGLSFPYSLRALLRALHKDERLALFGAPLFWSRVLSVGLVNFVASAPVVLFALALVVKDAEAARAGGPPVRRRRIGLALLGLALFYLHLSAFALFVGQALLVTWLGSADRLDRPALTRALQRLPRRALWLAPSLLAAAAVSLRSRLVSDGARVVHYMPRGQLLRLLPVWAFEGFHSPWCARFGVALVATGLVLGGAAWAQERASAGDVPRGPEAARSTILGVLLFSTSLLLYLALPSEVGRYGYLLDVRMALFVALFAPLLLRPARGAWGSVPLAAVAVLALLTSANAAVQSRAFDQEEVGGFDALLQRLPHGAKLLTLNFDPTSKYVDSRPFTYFGAYYRARYGGIAAASFANLDHWPTRYRPEVTPSRFAQTWGANPCAFRNSRDGAFFDYILARGDVEPFANVPPGPKWTLVGSSRAWELFARVRDDAAGDVRGDGVSVDPADHGPCAPLEPRDSFTVR